jgi:hypothetical protein
MGRTALTGQCPLEAAERDSAENDDDVQQGRKAANHYHRIERDDAESGRRHQNSAERRRGLVGTSPPFEGEGAGQLERWSWRRRLTPRMPGRGRLIGATPTPFP